MFINSYVFKAEVAKASLAAFFAHVSPEHYCFLVPPTGGHVYGYFLSQDIMEYFTNEFPVKSLQIIPPNEMKKIAANAHTLWGSRELLHTL